MYATEDRSVCCTATCELEVITVNGRELHKVED